MITPYEALLRSAPGWDGMELRVPQSRRPQSRRRPNAFALFCHHQWDIAFPSGTRATIDLVLASARRWARMKRHGLLHGGFAEMRVGPFVVAWYAEEI